VQSGNEKSERVSVNERQEAGMNWSGAAASAPAGEDMPGVSSPKRSECAENIITFLSDSDDKKDKNSLIPLLLF
jgi:hypothetical protein